MIREEYMSSMEREWAKERLAAMMEKIGSREGDKTTHVDLGGVSLRVSGPGTVLVIAAGLQPGKSSGGAN